jgi:hypothetical protein
MNNKLTDFIKLHPNYIITHINNEPLCIEEDYIYNMYYIKLQIDKYPDVNWSNYSEEVIQKFDLDDATVINIHYSEDIDLFD